MPIVGPQVGQGQLHRRHVRGQQGPPRKEGQPFQTKRTALWWKLQENFKHFRKLFPLRLTHRGFDQGAVNMAQTVARRITARHLQAPRQKGHNFGAFQPSPRGIKGRGTAQFRSAYGAQHVSVQDTGRLGVTEKVVAIQLLDGNMVKTGCVCEEYRDPVASTLEYLVQWKRLQVNQNLVQQNFHHCIDQFAD